MSLRHSLGFNIRATNAQEEGPTKTPLYDFSRGFWENYEKGPRRLTSSEQTQLARLSDEIHELDPSARKLEVRLLGRKIPSPVALASGPAPNSAWIGFFAEVGYDLLTYKTVRDRAWRGHGMPNLLHVEGNFAGGFGVAKGYTGSITNSLGMPCPEPEVWKKEVRKVVDKRGKKFLAVSITATVSKDTSETEIVEQFSKLSSVVKEVGADAVELNLSCPNVAAGEGGEVYRNPSLSGRIVEGVRSRVGSGFPILLKSGYLKDYAQLVDETWDPRVAHIVINSIAAQVRAADGSLPFADRGGKAGICGEAIRGFALSAVQNLARIRDGGREFAILAVGGVTDASSALNLLDAGADVVQSASGAILDPLLALRIKKSLLERGGGHAEA